MRQCAGEGAESLYADGLGAGFRGNACIREDGLRIGEDAFEGGPQHFPALTERGRHHFFQQVRIRIRKRLCAWDELDDG